MRAELRILSKFLDFEISGNNSPSGLFVFRGHFLFSVGTCYRLKFTNIRRENFWISQFLELRFLDLWSLSSRFLELSLKISRSWIWNFWILASLSCAFLDLKLCVLRFYNRSFVQLDSNNLVLVIIFSNHIFFGVGSISNAS